MSFLDACKEIAKFLLAIILAPFVLGMWTFGEWWSEMVKKRKKRQYRHIRWTLIVLTAPLFIFYPLAWLGTKFVEDF
jgi:hypothetical protein